MNDETALLAEISEHPEDEAPRLVYADWLEERANPLGEFIRLQCETATLPVGTWKRRKLRSRELALLAEHEKLWTEPIARRVEKYDFDRGLVSYVRMTAANFLKYGDEVLNAAPITRLRLEVSLDDLSACLNKPCMSRVLHLEIIGRQIGPLGAQKIAASPRVAQLKSLSLNGCWIQNDGVKSLAGSPHLRNLETLKIHSNGFQSPGLSALAKSPNLSRVTSLDVASNAVTVESVQELLLASPLPPLRSLNLCYTVHDPDVAVALAQSKHPPTLERLDLTNSLLGGSPPEGAAALQSAVWENLTELTLNWSMLSDGGFAAILGSTMAARLETLECQGCSLTSASARRLAIWPRLAKVRRLNLNSNRISEPGMEALVSSEYAKRKSGFSLAGNNINRQQRLRLERTYGKTVGRALRWW